MERVGVLRNEELRVVRHEAGVVRDRERRARPLRAPLGHRERRGLLLLVLQFLDVRLCIAFLQPRLLVEQGEDADVFRLEELEHGGVVGEVDALPRHALGLVLELLLAEDVCVELLLELLVGEVDAELLERVRLEVLEAEDVEDADERGGLLPLRLGTRERR